uniref:Uncharacterized protein n=1 Tax=Meloidogyne enterolobii TaxID=390850 RepID=A0A6V7UGJ9_MELEN|nr:unnamed protein product [Meloidogyne enterolobii]
MNRFSTADKLNKSRPAILVPRGGKGEGNHQPSSTTILPSTKTFLKIQEEKQSYREQLLSSTVDFSSLSSIPFVAWLGEQCVDSPSSYGLLLSS